MIPKMYNKIACISRTFLSPKKIAKMSENNW